MSKSPKDNQFAQFDFSKSILQALVEAGYEQPTPIQLACIPEMLKGSDIAATAQTGTGKTAAFALPLLEQLTPNDKSTQALILAPTRELAIQVATALQTYATFIRGISILPIYGGQGMDSQLRQLKRGAQIVVGTPGRVMDHLRRKTLKLHSLKTIVLDEADEMLRMGFIEDVEWILDHTPKNRQIALFSATMPAPIRKIAERHLQSAQHIAIKSETKTVSSIDQYYWLVKGTSKLEALNRILASENYDGIVIFVRTKNNTVELSDKLAQMGQNVAAINGDMNQSLREKTIEKLRKGQINILVATDVVARGIDVARVSHVFNYDMPHDSDVYIHRIGRTGRAGRSGKAILFVTPRERHLLKAIEKHTKQLITQVSLPSTQQVVEKRMEQLKEDIKKLIQQPKDQRIVDLTHAIQSESDVDWEELSSALVMALHQKNPVFSSKDHSSREPRESREPRNSRESRESRQEREPRRDRASNKKQSKNDFKPNVREPKPIYDEDGSVVESENYKLAVGHNDGVKPKDIVGAIANEADLSSQFIGQIIIHDDYSIVNLPSGMPKETFQHLKKVRVRQKPLQIELFKERK